MQGLRRLAVALITLSAIAAGAQRPGTDIVIAPPPAAPQDATGTVIGVVIAQDTRRPVRFAQVLLQSTALLQDGNFGGAGMNIRTDIDGTFLADTVAPGDYYVTATSVGYISARSTVQAQIAAGADAAAVLAALPIVHVTPNSASNVTVTLERGGTLAGHLEWEDGSPAAGVSVQTLLNTASTLPAGLRGVQGFGGGSSFQITDDRGNFRATGLSSGDYVVSAIIQPATQPVPGSNGFGRSAQYASPIRIYAPGVFRKIKAAVISIRAGDERTDVRLILDLRGLHAISGAAVSASAGQAVASGRVSISDPNDASLQISGSMTPQGTFKLPYVPPGNYTLQVTGASTTVNNGFGRRGGSTTSAITFQPFSQPLVVGETDVSGVAITLTPVAPSPAP